MFDLVISHHWITHDFTTCVAVPTTWLDLSEPHLTFIAYHSKLRLTLTFSANSSLLCRLSSSESALDELRSDTDEYLLWVELTEAECMELTDNREPEVDRELVDGFREPAEGREPEVDKEPADRFREQLLCEEMVDFLSESKSSTKLGVGGHCVVSFCCISVVSFNPISLFSKLLKPESIKISIFKNDWSFLSRYTGFDKIKRIKCCFL